MRLVLSLVLVPCLVIAAVVADVEERAVPPGIGEQAPLWSDLEGVDGKRHSLDDLAKNDVIVLCFTCNSCPYAVDYEDRLISLQQRFTSGGGHAQLIAINSNTIPADRMDRMQQRAADRKFKFPYLWDASQEVAKAYGAIYTPEFFVLNRERRIVYKGALDDSTDAEKVSEKYVEQAVNATLAGRVPDVSQTGARGCTIRFERRRRKPTSKS